MAEANFIIIPALVMGGIIGLIEMFFVHSDEVGMNWFTHGLHAFPFALAFTFASMNVDFVLKLVGITLAPTSYVNLGVRVAIGLISALKIKGAAATKAITQAVLKIGSKNAIFPVII